MIYKRIALMLTSFIILCGCTGVGGQTGDTPSGNAVGDAVGQDGAKTASTCAYSDTTVIDTGNGGELVYRTNKGETIVGAAGSSGTFFLLTYRESISDDNFSNEDSQGISENAAVGNNAAETMPFLLTAVNKNVSVPEFAVGKDGLVMAGMELEMAETDINLPWVTVQEIDSFPASMSGEMFGCYQGKLYMIYHIYEEDTGVRRRYAYCYEQQADGSVAKSQDTLCTTIMDLYDQGYLFCGGAEDLFAGLNAYDRLLAWDQEEAKVYAVAVDGSILWERSIDAGIMNMKGTDGRILVGVGSTENADGRYYFIYDLEGTFADGTDVKEGTYAWTDGSYLGVRDGYLYFYRYNKTAYNRNQYFFYRCYLYDINAEEELLYETQDVAGQPYQREGNNGAAGFTVRGDACYFMDFDGKCLWWFSCDLSDDAHALTRLDVVNEYHGIFDAGKITYASDSYRCEDCGELIYEYYIEGIQLYGDGDPVIDRINEALTEEMAENSASMAERLSNYQTAGTAVGEHVCGSYTNRTTFESIVDGVTWYRFRKEGQDGEWNCLEVDYSGYDYSGGVHGYPWRSHFLFDLSDGSQIGMSGVTDIDEEEFRTLAAEYTLADYLGENGDLYFETQEDVLTETVYQYVSFDCDMYLGAEGIVIEYSPYHLGPYGSGYIEVTVPYDKLGLELLKIDGVNE